jgi:hypothetical protein
MKADINSSVATVLVFTASNPTCGDFDDLKKIYLGVDETVHLQHECIKFQYATLSSGIEPCLPRLEEVLTATGNPLNAFAALHAGYTGHKPRLIHRRVARGTEEPF